MCVSFMLLVPLSRRFSYDELDSAADVLICRVGMCAAAKRAERSFRKDLQDGQ